MATTATAAAAPGSLVVICVEESESLVEPMCSTAELQQDLVPYVMSQLLQNAKFVKMAKPERQAKVRMLTQKMLGGETGTGGPDDEAEQDIAPHRFWSHLRTKYGTRRGHLLQMLRYLEPAVQHQRVVVLRFQSEVAAPTASVLVRASQPCSTAGVAAVEEARRDFAAGTFQVDALGNWLHEAPGAGGGGRAPPLWARLIAECSAPDVREVRALVICTEAQSTDMTPQGIAMAAHAFKSAKLIPYLSSVAFGAQASERLAALSEISAWAGGLSFNVSDQSTLQPAADGLCASLFSSQVLAKDFLERRMSYSQKQALSTCYLPLPRLVQCEEPASPVSVGGSPTAVTKRALWSQTVEDLLRGSGKIAFDGTCPSESMLAVLSDTTLALPRRWGRSLRCFRERRELRDVVFGEPGGLGLELDEPTAVGGPPSAATEKQRTWRLRATHPPASSLKMKEQSVLLAINLARVHEHTPRSEIARRVSARPVALTFENPRNEGDAHSAASAVAAARFAAASGEVAVGELREKLQPLRKDAPPLSVALGRVAAAQGTTALGIRQRQADRLLSAAAAWGAGVGVGRPAWAADVPEGAPAADGLRAAASFHALAQEPCCLFNSLLFCADVPSFARAGMTCRSWRHLIMHDARSPGAGGSSGSSDGGGGGAAAGGAKASLQHRLWQWALRWGNGPGAAQRVGFWRWVLAEPRGVSATSAFAPPSPGASDGAGGSANDDAGTGSLASEAVLKAAMATDAAGMFTLSAGLAGACPGLALAESALEGAAAAAGAPAPLPPEVLRGLLAGPLHGQRLWILGMEGLPWLVLQARCLQIALAARQPQLFRHFMGEGVAPELFYCRWLQRLFRGCAQDSEIVRLMDLFIFERSHKVFVRAGVALFGLLETKLRGDVDQIVEVLFHAERWDLEHGALLQAALSTKVTRKMLEDMTSREAARGSE